MNFYYSIHSIMQSSDYARAISVSVGISFIGIGVYFIRFWDWQAFVGLLMLIGSPLLIALGIIKTKVNDNDEFKIDEKKSSPI